MALHLTHEDQARVQAAIAGAEARAGAHIAFVAVPASDRYSLYPLLCGALLALVSGGIAVFIRPHLGFRQGFAGEAVIFVLVSLLLDWSVLRHLVVPGRIKRAHARVFAHREFAARILASPERRGGVLLFVSLAERYVELMGDREAHARVGQEAWDRIVVEFVAAAKSGRLADGAISAIDACASVLAAHSSR
jgi:putative membrane protein